MTHPFDRCEEQEATRIMSNYSINQSSYKIKMNRLEREVISRTKVLIYLKNKQK